MAFRTPFAGLLRLEEEDPISLGDYDFYTNTEVADAYFNAFANHQHDGQPAVQAFAASPSAVASASGGALSGGETWYIGVTAIDAFGGETIATTASASTTPGVTDPTIAPSAVASGAGTLQGGTYRYGYTYVSGSGETLISPVTNLAIPFNGRAVITRPASPSETWRVYRAFGNSNYARVAEIGASASTYADDGSVAVSSDQQPPDENTTNQSNSITVSRPSMPANAVYWRVYASQFSDVPSPALWSYDSNQQINIASASASIVFSSTDEILAGSPPPVSRTIPGASQILATQILYSGAPYLASGTVEEALDNIASALASAGTFTLRASGEASGLAGDVVLKAGKGATLVQAASANAIRIDGRQWRAGSTGTFTDTDMTVNSISGDYYGTNVSRSGVNLLIQGSRFNVGATATNYLGTRDYFTRTNAGSGVVAAETLVSGNDYRLDLSLSKPWLLASAVVASAGFASAAEKINDLEWDQASGSVVSSSSTLVELARITLNVKSGGVYRLGSNMDYAASDETTVGLFGIVSDPDGVYGASAFIRYSASNRECTIGTAQKPLDHYYTSSIDGPLDFSLRFARFAGGGTITASNRLIEGWRAQ